MLTNFVSGQFAAATRDFNDDLRPLVTPEILAGTKTQLDYEVGPFYLVKEAHQRQEGGFRAIELIAKFEKASVSVLVVFDAFDRIGSVYFNPILVPAVDPALETAARALLANFTAGRYDEAAKPFDTAMRQQLPPESMARLAASMAQPFGTFRSVTEVHQRIDNGNRIIDLVLSYTKSPVAFRVTFDAKGRVTALHISPYVKE